jgi:hypothetical protein
MLFLTDSCSLSATLKRSEAKREASDGLVPRGDEEVSFQCFSSIELVKHRVLIKLLLAVISL